MNEFGRRIIELRAEAGLTRKQFAEKLNVSPRLISYWETGGRECSFDTLIAIADLFGVTTDELLGRTDGAHASDTALLQDERALLEGYRALGREGRLKLEGYLAALKKE